MAALYTTISQSVGRAEGPERVTGAAKCPADVNLPGTLVGKCLRSPYPYTRIKSIYPDSVEAARQVPGVHAMLTSVDIPERLVGRMIRDLPVLARDVVRFVGQKVAADDADIAEKALNLIEVEMRASPGAGPRGVPEARHPGAPCRVHELHRHPRLPQEHANLVGHSTWKKGDVARGLAEADYVKMLFPVRQQLSEGIDVPQENIRVNPSFCRGRLRRQRLLSPLWIPTWPSGSPRPSAARCAW